MKFVFQSVENILRKGKQEGQHGPGSLTQTFERTIANFFYRISLYPYNASSPHSPEPFLLMDQNFTNTF